MSHGWLLRDLQAGLAQPCERDPRQHGRGPGDLRRPHRLVQPEMRGQHRDDREKVRIHRGARAADRPHRRVPDRVGDADRKRRRVDDLRPRDQADGGPVHVRERGRRQRHVEHRADQHRQRGHADGRMARHQRPRADGIERPAEHGSQDHQVAGKRGARRVCAAADDQVDAEERQQHAGPVHRADALLAADRREQRDGNRRRGEQQRAVGDARPGEPADEQELVEAVADEADPGQADPVLPRHGRRRMEDARDVGACGRVRVGRTAAPDQQVGGHHQRRRLDEAQRVERLGIDFAKRGFDQGVVRAPDERHQEQEGVESCHCDPVGPWAEGRGIGPRRGPRKKGQGKGPRKKGRGKGPRQRAKGPEIEQRRPYPQALIPRPDSVRPRPYPQALITRPDVVRALRAPGSLAERRQEEQDQRDQQHVDDEGLDEDEAQDQRAADVARRAGIARDRFGGGGNRLALAQRAERRGDPQREARADDRPLDDLEARGAGARLLRVERERDARHHHERRCPESPFTHNQFLPQCEKKSMPRPARGGRPGHHAHARRARVPRPLPPAGR